MNTTAITTTIALTAAIPAGALALPNIPSVVPPPQVDTPAGDLDLTAGDQQGVLIALLLPAVQKVREASHRNNLTTYPDGPLDHMGDTNGDGIDTFAVPLGDSVLFDVGQPNEPIAYLQIKMTDAIIASYQSRSLRTNDPWGLAAFEADGHTLAVLTLIDIDTPSDFGLGAIGLGDDIMIENGVPVGTTGLHILDITGLDFAQAAAAIEAFDPDAAGAGSRLYDGSATVTDTFGAAVTVIPAPGAGVLAIASVLCTARRRRRRR